MSFWSNGWVIKPWEPACKFTSDMKPALDEIKRISPSQGGTFPGMTQSHDPIK